MATGDFDAYYGVEPWSAIDIKERDWYVPELQRAFRQTSRYSQMVPIKVDFTAVRTKKIIWTGLWGLEPNITAIGDRSLWLPTMYPDGWQVELSLHTYGGKIALHRHTCALMAKSMMEKLALVTGKILARITAWQAGVSRAAVETERASALATA